MQKADKSSQKEGHTENRHQATKARLSVWTKLVLKFQDFSKFVRSDLLWKKNCSSDWKKKFLHIPDWRSRTCKDFLTTWTIYLNCERSEQCLVCGFLDLIQWNKKYSLNYRCFFFQIKFKILDIAYKECEEYYKIFSPCFAVLHWEWLSK